MANNDLKRKSACLAIRRVVGKCDYVVLEKLLESIHEEFKITATIKERGGNFVKAFHIFATNTTIYTTSNDEPQQLSDVMDHATHSSEIQTAIRHTFTHWPPGRPPGVLVPIETALTEFEEEDSEYSNRVARRFRNPRRNPRNGRTAN